MTPFSKLKKRLSVLAMALVAIGAFLALGTAGTVAYTSRSDFCNTCHIMEPYYQSWKHSKHHMVDCVECHFEPGLLETVDGKFKAVNQLTKYVTGTAGTKPWAEVSDQSCMRSGCHSERLLSGEITFGRVRFDHRHHLLETRRGRQLRCTSCHSQIVQGSHMSVTTSTCFLCHLRTSDLSKPHGECGTCHGAPKEDLAVAGRPFRHSEWTENGAECALCHRDVTRGAGTAKKIRCSGCHGDVAHIERFSDVAFIHENHITKHKIECDQCHDEIEHKLPERDHIATAGDCGKCHESLHQAQQFMRAGHGGALVEDRPDRMYETRVDCTGCHRETSPESRAAESRSPWLSAHRGIPPANEVACMHCHGAKFGGMLQTWTDEVQGAAGRLETALAALGRNGGGPGASAAALVPARANLDFVRADGSHGAHNVAYTLALLRKAKDVINEAGPGLDPRFEKLDFDIGVPKKLETRCADTCHVNAARLEGRFAGVVFKHRAHLAKTDLDCNACHDEEKHGVTTFKPQDCADCHHGKDKKPDCATCHDREAALFKGTVKVEGANLDLKNEMVKLDCVECHKDLGAKDVAADVRTKCVECHKNQASYGTMLDQWREAMAEEAKGVAERLASVEARLSGATGPAAAEARALFAKAKSCFEAAALAGPAHNANGASSLFSAAGSFLDECEKKLGK
jgi:nitrate/TMAO reductase-like tetraheme cytochrome c subunit